MLSPSHNDSPSCSRSCCHVSFPVLQKNAFRIKRVAIVNRPLFRDWDDGRVFIWTMIPTFLPVIIEGGALLFRALNNLGSEDSARSCTIEIRNQNQRLEFRYPQYYLYSGVSNLAPVPVISPNNKATCSFRKSNTSTFGTSGVVAYDIELISEKLNAPTSTYAITDIVTSSSTANVDPTFAHNLQKTDRSTQLPSKSENRLKEEASLVLMWSVPIMGVTSHALGIERPPFYTKDVLFQKLYYGGEKWYNREIAGVCVKYEDVVFGVPIKLYGSISNAGQATWIIDIQ